jgi:hypothetical protein
MKGPFIFLAVQRVMDEPCSADSRVIFPVPREVYRDPVNPCPILHLCPVIFVIDSVDWSSYAQMHCSNTGKNRAPPMSVNIMIKPPHNFFKPFVIIRVVV